MGQPIGGQPIDRAVSSAGFHIISEDSGARLLGLRVGERNRRVARRAGALSRPPDGTRPTLVVPPGAAVTPALFQSLPPPDRACELVWARGRPPIVWRPPAGDEPPHVVALPDGVVLDVSDRASRRRAAWRLLGASGKPTDGWLSRHVHRRISRVCSYALLGLGLSKNMATLLPG
jgi:hypothetical protein